jgi:hypothetical protein
LLHAYIHTYIHTYILPGSSVFPSNVQAVDCVLLHSYTRCVSHTAPCCAATYDERLVVRQCEPYGLTNSPSHCPAHLSNGDVYAAHPGAYWYTSGSELGEQAVFECSSAKNLRRRLQAGCDTAEVKKQCTPGMNFCCDEGNCSPCPPPPPPPPPPSQPPPPPPPPPVWPAPAGVLSVQASVTLSQAISVIPAGSAARHKFVTQFELDISRLIKVGAERVNVTHIIGSGSTRVSFEVSPKAQASGREGLTSLLTAALGAAGVQIANSKSATPVSITRHEANWYSQQVGFQKAVPPPLKRDQVCRQVDCGSAAIGGLFAHLVGQTCYRRDYNRTAAGCTTLRDGYMGQNGVRYTPDEVLAAGTTIYAYAAHDTFSLPCPGTEFLSKADCPDPSVTNGWTQRATQARLCLVSPPGKGECHRSMLPAAVCDGSAECADGSDEADCSEASTGSKLLALWSLTSATLVCAKTMMGASLTLSTHSITAMLALWIQLVTSMASMITVFNTAADDARGSAMLITFALPHVCMPLFGMLRLYRGNSPAVSTLVSISSSSSSSRGDGSAQGGRWLPPKVSETLARIKARLLVGVLNSFMATDQDLRQAPYSLGAILLLVVRCALYFALEKQRHSDDRRHAYYGLSWVTYVPVVVLLLLCNVREHFRSPPKTLNIAFDVTSGMLLVVALVMFCRDPTISGGRGLLRSSRHNPGSFDLLPTRAEAEQRQVTDSFGELVPAGELVCLDSFNWHDLFFYCEDP